MDGQAGCGPCFGGLAPKDASARRLGWPLPLRHVECWTYSFECECKFTSACHPPIVPQNAAHVSRKVLSSPPPAARKRSPAGNPTAFQPKPTPRRCNAISRSRTAPAGRPRGHRLASPSTNPGRGSSFGRSWTERAGRRLPSASLTTPGAPERPAQAHPVGPGADVWGRAPAPRRVPARIVIGRRAPPARPILP